MGEHQAHGSTGGGAETIAVASIRAGTLSWTFLQIHAGGRIVVNEALIPAYQDASSPHFPRALKSDLEAFYLWCRHTKRIALSATPAIVADYLDARVRQGAKPTLLGRYKASIAKIHQLPELKDPTQAEVVKPWLPVIRREKGSVQAEARPLRFKGPVRETPRDQRPRAMDALRWRSPRMPVAYNRNLAAKSGAVGGLVGRMG